MPNAGNGMLIDCHCHTKSYGPSSLLFILDATKFKNLNPKLSSGV